MLDINPTYRAMLAVDIERSAGRGDVALLRCREVLFSALREAFAESMIDWVACHREDGGDGMRVIVGPDVAKTRLIHPLVHHLAARLRAHNRTAGASTQIRVRLALHAGDVHVRDGQVAGRSLEVLARLLEAEPAKRALSTAPPTTTVALIVSGHVYDEAVRHGYPGIDPDTYRPVAYRVKETAAMAWMHVPDAAHNTPQEPGPNGDRLGAQHIEPGPAARADTLFQNVATGNARVGTQIGQVLGGLPGSSEPIPVVDGLSRQLEQLRTALIEVAERGELDSDTFAAAEAELREAASHLPASEELARNRFVLVMKRLKGLVDGIADLATKVANIISAARGVR